MSSQNIVLICLDTVRKDYFSEFAPRIQDLSEVSVEQCRSASSWTVPSHASMFTGQLPHEHGVHAHDTEASTIRPADTFLSQLDGYHTIGVSANAYVSSEFGWDDLFDDFYDIAPSVLFSEGMYLREFSSERSGVFQFYDYMQQMVRDDHPIKSFLNAASHGVSTLKPSFLPRWDDDGAEAVTKRAINEVRRSGEPYFMFLNYMDAHAPFKSSMKYDSEFYRSVPNGWSSEEIDIWEYNLGHTDEYEEDIENYRSLYAAAIDYLDRTVERLVSEIEEISENEVTFVITADHGENLGYEEDNHLIEHKSSLTEGLLHVPLLLVNTPESGRTDKKYVSHLDLSHLITQLAERQLSVPTRSEVPAELVGLGAQEPPLDPADLEYFDRMIRALYEGTEKTVWDSLGNCAQYELDPNRSCFQQKKPDDVLDDMIGKRFFSAEIDVYKSHAKSQQSRSETSASVEDRLEHLGYR